MATAAKTVGGAGEASAGFVVSGAQKGPTAPEFPIPLNPPAEGAAAGFGNIATVEDGPSISIVVAAHLRPDYIVGAVESVVRSGLRPSQIDIVVTKGYRSVEQEEVLRRLGARVFHDFDVGVGLQLWRAVPLTRAPLVAFLDDDDQFETTRLEHVCRIFHDHPEVGFYRNRVKLIDIAGELVPTDLYDPEELDALLDRTGPLQGLSVKDPTSFRLLQKCHPWFNTSTIVVRRELLIGPFGHLLATAHHAPDVRLYLMGVLSGAGIYIDDQRLTRYRTSFPTWSQQAKRAADDLDSVRMTAQLAQRFAPAPWPTQFWTLVRDAEERVLWSEFVSQLEKGRPRVEVTSTFIDYLRFLLSHPRAIHAEPSRIFYIACLASYQADPSLGAAILTKALTTASINRSRRRTGRNGSSSGK
jgi:hypothetical protein